MSLNQGAGLNLINMSWILTICFIALLGGTSVHGDGTYFLSSPKTITRGSMYNITVDILNGSSVEVTAAINSRKYNGVTNRYDIFPLKTASMEFQQGIRGNLGFWIEDDFKCDDCRLTVQGRGDQTFERSQAISIKTKVVSVLIQTDKAMYKPGEKVRYRVLAVYPNLQVYKGTFSVTIKDPSGYKIKVDEGLRGESGVVEGFLDLTDQPPFGDWTIQATVEEVLNSELQTFTVSQYELPRYEVVVDLPSFALLNDTMLTGKVKAKYTFGKPVNGMVELLIGPDRGPDSCGRLPKTVNTAFEIDGEATFSVPKSSIQQVMRVQENTEVRVTALVKESATGVKLNGSNSVKYHSTKNTITFMSNTPGVFKPGLPYIAHVQVKAQDGLPPSEESRKFDVVVYPYATYKVIVDDQNKYGTHKFTGTYPLPTMTLSVPENGILPIYVNIPNNATEINLMAYFRGMRAMKKVSKTYSVSNNHLQLTLQNSDIKSGDVATFDLEATEPMDTIYYQVISRGSLIKSGMMSGNGESSVTFELTTTAAMGPVSNLITNYIREGGEIVADSIAFNVDGIFDNKVSVDFSDEKAMPGDNVQLKVTADEMSQVYLLAVDQSVLLLKGGNDIDIEKVQEGISDQNPLDSEFALSHSAANVGEVFTKSGLIYFTDSAMSKPLPPYRSRYFSRGPPGAIFEDALHSEGATLKNVAIAGDRIRKIFPEAWLWTNITTHDGTAVIDTAVPDTITTWVASAFATNLQSGLGVSATKANITVFSPFFISLNYPSIVKRSEKAVIQATVFNYMPNDVQVVVSISDAKGYKHIKVSPEDSSETVTEKSEPKQILVKSNSQEVVYFPILAKKVGVFDVEVKAQSPLAADGVSRQIIIEPEGAPSTYSIPFFIDQKKRRQYTSNSFVFPDSTVKDSEKVSVAVSGDLIGPSLDNLDHLLVIPTGCGEQNMVKFAPNIYIAKYLESTGQLTPAKRSEIVDKLLAGYQRQLSFLRYDLSFSPFGNNDQSGSTWLTAYVTRTLSEVREYIYIDPRVITDAVDWLVNTQKTDGSFVELGRVIDPNTQGSDTGPALTAYCLLTLLQNKDLISVEKCQSDQSGCDRTFRWNNATKKAIDNIEGQIDSISDPFSLSVVTYALSVAQSPKSKEALDKLANMTISEGGLQYWKGTSKSSKTPVPVYSIWKPPVIKSRPVNVLITSYALLSYTTLDKLEEALPIVKWLVSQRNSNGGFASTQDTTVALQALSAYASVTTRPRTKLRVVFRGSSGESLRFAVNNRNLLNFQRREFKNTKTNENDRKFTVNMNSLGFGYAIGQIEYKFHTNTVEPSSAFDVSTVLLDDDLDSFNLMVCSKWIKDEKSGMVVQEIEIPSGFEPDLSSIGSVVGIKKYERKGSVVAVYFDEMLKTSTCYSMLMTRTAKVAQSAQTFIHTFSYYKPEDKSVIFYQPKSLRDSSICDVCEGCCE